MAIVPTSRGFSFWRLHPSHTTGYPESSEKREDGNIFTGGEEACPFPNLPPIMILLLTSGEDIIYEYIS